MSLPFSDNGHRPLHGSDGPEDGLNAMELSELADRLSGARAAGRPIERLEREFRPASLEEGYAVQAAVRYRAKAEVAGYKVGLTSAAAQAAFSAESPVAGTLAARDVIWSPARVEADGLPQFAEAEVVFVIGHALPPDGAPYSEADIRDSLASVHVGIELCSTRYAWDEVSLAELVADNSNASRIVVGSELQNGRELDFSGLPVVLRRKGHEDVEGSTSAVLGDPIRAVTWLANWLANRGEGLKPGDVVASGSCTGVTALGDAEELVAVFGPLGRAHVIITPAGDTGEPT